MAKKEKFEIRITTEELRLALRDALSGSRFSTMVSDVIINNLSITEIGLEQVYKALGGIAPIAKFKVLDKVLVNNDALPTWRVDKAATEKLLFQDKMKAVITEVDLQKRSPYKVEYEYIDNGGGLDPVKGSWDVQEECITLVEDNFIDDQPWPK